MTSVVLLSTLISPFANGQVFDIVVEHQLGTKTIIGENNIAVECSGPDVLDHIPNATAAWNFTLLFAELMQSGNCRGLEKTFEATIVGHLQYGLTWKEIPVTDLRGKDRRLFVFAFEFFFVKAASRGKETYILLIATIRQSDRI